MSEKVRAEELPVAKVLSSDFHFEIPSYQRPYAWGREEVDQLFDDLVSWMEDEARRSNADPNPYFLGSVVIIKSPDAPRAEVVDGQQRLTTLTLFLVACSERLPTARTHLVGHLRDKGSPFIKHAADRLRLTPRDRDRAFYEKHIMADAGIDRSIDPATLAESQRNLWRNALRFVERLSSMTDSAVQTLLRLVLNDCYLVVVRTSDFTSAYRIFSVLNDRGLDLSPTDILKARLIGDTPEAAREGFTKVWEDTEETLGRGPFLELFSHIRMINRKFKLRTNLLDELTKDVLPNFKPEAFIEKQVVPYANALDILKHATFEASAGAEAANLAIRQLGRVDNFDWLPAAMAFLVQRPGDGNAVARFLRDLERLAASMMVRRVYVNDRIERYSAILQAIEKATDLYADDSPLQLDGKERADTRTVLDGDIYSNVRVRLPLLLRLDGIVADTGATYDHQTVTIEHVLPQTPASGSDWLTNFPDQAVRDGWTHRLGNLVLLSRRKNSAASNLPFGKKKQEYFVHKGVAPFALTTSVVNEPEWTGSVLARRQKELVGKLVEAWRLS